MRQVSLVASGLGVLLVGITLGAAGVAWLHPAPDRSAIANATKTPRVTAAVEMRPARAPVTIQVRLSTSAEIAVTPLAVSSSSAPASNSGSGSTGSTSSTSSPTAKATAKATAAANSYVAPVVRDVVSARPPTIGKQVRIGDLLGEVSGHPVFALQTQAPLYRDLVPGCTGPDVKALQQLLAKRGYFHDRFDGQFRHSTLVALASWFQRYGYRLPNVATGVTGLPLADVAQLPAATVTVSARAGIGSVVDGDHPLLRVRAKGPQLAGRADELQRDALTVGTAVTVQVGSSAPMSSRVIAVSPFRESQTGTPSGHDIAVAVPRGLVGAAAGGEPISVSEVLQAPKAPSVPLTAIRQNGSGAQYLLLVQGTTATQVAVTVVGQLDGYAILDAGTAPASGALVVVSGA